MVGSVGIGEVLDGLGAELASLNKFTGGILAEGFLTNASAQLLLGESGFVFEVTGIVLVNTSGAGRVVNLYSSMISTGPDWNLIDKDYALASKAKVIFGVNDGWQFGYDNILRGKDDLGGVTSYVIFGRKRQLT